MSDNKTLCIFLGLTHDSAEDLGFLWLLSDCGGDGGEDDDDVVDRDEEISLNGHLSRLLDGDVATLIRYKSVMSSITSCSKHSQNDGSQAILHML